jgi:hypothetical protein
MWRNPNGRLEDAKEMKCAHVRKVCEAGNGPGFVKPVINVTNNRRDTVLITWGDAPGPAISDLAHDGLDEFERRFCK